MNINNNITNFIKGMTFVATGAVGLVTTLLVDNIKDKYEIQDKEAEVDENVQISAEDFAAMQNELEELKMEIVQLKGAEGAKETTESESSNISVEAGDLAVLVQDETTTPSQSTQTPTTETKETNVVEKQPSDKPSSENKDNQLKELDIANLTQSEASAIWTSYLKGNCEYDLNDNNIEKFCLKFGFDSSLAK